MSPWQDLGISIISISKIFHCIHIVENGGEIPSTSASSFRSSWRIPMLCIWESYHWDSLGIHGKSAPDDEHPPWLQQQLSLRLAPISRANCGCISKCTGPVQWVISPSVSVKSWNSSGHFCCEHMLRVAKSVPTKPISPAGSVTVPGKNKIPWSNMTQLAGQSPTWTEFVGDFIVATSDGR